MHHFDDCPFKEVCEYNDSKPPYCNECVVPVVVVEKPTGQSFPNLGEVWYFSKDDKDSLWLKCPRCGNCIVLRDEHEIRVEGNVVTVSPSVGCRQCRFHAYLRMGEWQLLTDY